MGLGRGVTTGALGVGRSRPSSKPVPGDSSLASRGSGPDQEWWGEVVGGRAEQGRRSGSCGGLGVKGTRATRKG